MSDHHFGVSTHLFHESRLSREQLDDIAGHGFDAVEVFATRAHFDYHDPRAAAQLAEWLSDLGLAFHSMHAPIVEAIRDGAPDPEPRRVTVPVDLVLRRSCGCSR